MADREKRHIDSDVLQPVEEEDHTEEEKKVIVAGHHMFGAQIEIWPELQALFALQKVSIAFGHTMSERKRGN